MKALLFYFIAMLLTMSSLMVISARNPVHSALWLVSSFISAAGIFLLLEAEFLAMSLILVYVGAVMVLFLFVIMMLDINIAKMREGFLAYLPLGAMIGLIMIAEIAIVLGGQPFATMPAPEPSSENFSNTQAIGTVLYTQYVYPFEIAAVILLLAIIIAISLTQRKRPDSKYQVPERQIHINRNDRVRMVNIPSESDNAAVENNAGEKANENA